MGQTSFCPSISSHNASQPASSTKSDFAVASRRLHVQRMTDSDPLFLQVTSIGTGKIGWPSVLFNLAGGLLVQKRRAEKVLEESSMSYLIVRPGGMERPGEQNSRG